MRPGARRGAARRRAHERTSATRGRRGRVEPLGEHTACTARPARRDRGPHERSRRVASRGPAAGPARGRAAGALASSPASTARATCRVDAHLGHARRRRATSSTSAPASARPASTTSTTPTAAPAARTGAPQREVARPGDEQRAAMRRWRSDERRRARCAPPARRHRPHAGVDHDRAPVGGEQRGERLGPIDGRERPRSLAGAGAAADRPAPRAERARRRARQVAAGEPAGEPGPSGSPARPRTAGTSPARSTSSAPSATLCPARRPAQPPRRWCPSHPSTTSNRRARRLPGRDG